MNLFEFAAADARGQFTAPEPAPARLIPSAGHGYTVRYSRVSGHAHALDCAFCLFTVYPRECALPTDHHPGERYGRAKRAVVAHILGQHADEFSNLSEAQS